MSKLSVRQQTRIPNGFLQLFITLSEHCPAILPDYRMAFSLKGMPYVEPSYANIQKAEGEEVHGVAFCMTKESGEELDRTEGGYIKNQVQNLADLLGSCPENCFLL